MKKITTFLSILTIGAAALHAEEPNQRKVLFSSKNSEECTGSTCDSSSDGFSLDSLPTYAELSTGFGWTPFDSSWKVEAGNINKNREKTFSILPVNVAFGAVIMDQFRAELAINYGHLFKKTFFEGELVDNVKAKAEVSGWELGIMLNGYYDMPIQDAIDGFVGAGIGFDYVSLTGEGNANNEVANQNISLKKDESKVRLSAQIMGGILYHFDDNLTLVAKLGFKYVQAMKYEYTVDEINGKMNIDAKPTRIFVNVGVQYYF